MAAIHFLLVVVFVSCASAQIQFPGKCPNVTVVDPFDATRYLGKWYEIESYFQVFSAGAACSTALYTDMGNGTIGVYNTQINGQTGQFSSINGTARITDPNGTAGKLGVTFPVSAGEAPYWVLNTNYDDFSIVFACRDYGTVNFQTIWYLSRVRNPTFGRRQEVREYLQAAGLNTDQLNETRQTDCPPSN